MRSWTTACVNASKHGMYTKDASASRVVVGVYVDDLIITGGDAGAVVKFKVQM